jgi:protein TonB
VPAPINTAPAVPADSTQNPPHEDVSATAAATASGSARGKEGSKGEEWSRDANYVGPDFNVRYFSNPKPDYPPQSRRLREQGLVKLRVHVSEEGSTREVMLHTSSGYERLDNAALDAVRRWRFRPAQRAGTPVAGWVVVPVRFELQG